MNRVSTMLQMTILVCVSCMVLGAPPARDVTFLSASDAHYREPDHRAGCHNDLNHASVEEMNRIADLCGVKFSKMPDGKQQHTWDGRWEWKWFLDKKIAAETAPK